MISWLGKRRPLRASGRSDRGQAVVMVAILMVVFLGMAGLVIDVANLDVTQRHLQTAADAAALAAAQDLPGSTAAACTFSASPAGNSTCTVNQTNVPLSGNGDNYNGSFGNVQTMATIECLSVASAGTPCQTGAACPTQYGPAGNSSNLGCNAIQVTEQTSVTPFFMGVLGFGSQTVTATATAGIAGGAPRPLNVEILDDTTESMQCPGLSFGCPAGFTGATICGGLPTDVPSSVLNDLTQEDCAKAGIRALLTQLLPCSPQVSCGSTPSTDQTTDPNGAVDDVGLITFPGVTGLTQTAPDGKTPIAETDCTQNVGTSNVSYATSANYQIVPFFERLPHVRRGHLAGPVRNAEPGLQPGQGGLLARRRLPERRLPDPGRPDELDRRRRLGRRQRREQQQQHPGRARREHDGGRIGDHAGELAAGGRDGQHLAREHHQQPVEPSRDQRRRQRDEQRSEHQYDHQRHEHSDQPARNNATRQSGDFLLVTVTAQGTGVNMNASICPAATTTGWTLVDQHVSGNVIQATYWSIRNNTAAETYTFNFWGGSCGNGGAIGLAASAIALRYSNVSGVDTPNGVGANIGGPTTANDSGSAPSTSWLASTTTDANTAIGSASWTTTTAWASFTQGAGQCASFAACATTVASSGTLTGGKFTFATAPGFTRTFTVTLEINGVPAPAAGGTATCPIGGFAGTSSCTISGTWTVNAGDKIALAVQLTGGTTSLTSAATDSATLTSGSNTNYVSLASQCVNTSATVCDDETVPSPGGSFTSANLTFGLPVPAGDTFTVTLFRNDTSTGLTCPITATHTSCTTPITGTLALATGDTLELQVTHTGTAALTTTATTTVSPPARRDGPHGSAGDDRAAERGGRAPVRHRRDGIRGGERPRRDREQRDRDRRRRRYPGGRRSDRPRTESVSSNAQDNWVAQTVALQATLPSSINVQTPTGYAAGNGFVLATIGVSNLPTGVLICAPTGWNLVQATPKTNPSSGASPNQVTQESFYTSQTTAAGTYTFNFRTACGTATSGVGVGASSVAVNYTGVDPTTPLDLVTPLEATGSSAAPTSPALTTGSIDDTVVSLFATDANTLSTTGGVVQNSSWVSTGINDEVEQQPGAAPAQTGTTAAAPWTAEAVALRPALPMSITIPAVAGYSPTNGNNDLLLVSISARGLGTNTICPPDATNWTRLANTTSGTGANEITQTSFWTTSETTYAFTFNSNANCQGNNLVPAAASAVATNYAGVNTATPIGVTPNLGSGKALAATATNVPSEDEVVDLFATGDSFASAAPPFLTPQTSSIWTSIGESATVQQASGSQTVGPAMAGSINSASWTSQAVVLTPLLSSSITVTPPTGYLGGGSDLMLVTISAANLGSGSICAPDATWSRVPLATAGLDVYTVSSGTVTQAAFLTSTSAASSDVFSFYAKPNCEGAPLGVGASAVAVYYTGVDTASPFDATPVSASGSSTTLQPGQITTTVAGDELVSLFGSGATTLNSTIAVAGNGLSPASGVNNVNPPPQHNPGANTPASATSNASADWTAETIALQPLLKTGIVVQRPPNPNANDFLVVTVTAKGLTSGNICAPNDGTWTELNGAMSIETANGLTTDQATWYGFRATASPESYTFTFETSCSASATPLTASATALAVRFTGVNPITPVDENAQGLVAGTTKGPGSTSAVGPGATVSPPHTGDWAVTMFGTGATGLTMTTCSPTPSKYTGFESGTTGTASATGFCGWDQPRGQRQLRDACGDGQLDRPAVDHRHARARVCLRRLRHHLRVRHRGPGRPVALHRLRPGDPGSKHAAEEPRADRPEPSRGPERDHPPERRGRELQPDDHQDRHELHAVPVQRRHPAGGGGREPNRPRYLVLHDRLRLAVRDERRQLQPRQLDAGAGDKRDPAQPDGAVHDGADGEQRRHRPGARQRLERAGHTLPHRHRGARRSRPPLLQRQPRELARRRLPADRFEPLNPAADQQRRELGQPRRLARPRQARAVSLRSGADGGDQAGSRTITGICLCVFCS